ncbi:MAG: TonB-dependent siderophore receptor [Leptolyngbya sp. SIO1E4]|nr:TonB-dependent siderophore receptor [Leptolyngbya sp. SIO1E4]
MGCIRGVTGQTRLAKGARWVLMVALSGSGLGILAMSAQAETPSREGMAVSSHEDTLTVFPDYPVTSLSDDSPPDFTQYATTVSEWMAQIEASRVQITGICLEATATGLQIVLETAAGELPAPVTEIVGNALIAEIPNTVLALPEGDSFEQFEPAEGIALVQVTNEPGDRVRVAITGTDAPPVAEITTSGLMVTVGEAVATTEDDAIQIIVAGEADEGYTPSAATTATRTDTPLRDIPQSIQVIPRQVLEDRNVRTVSEAVETVSGVINASGYFGAPGLRTRIIRGFDQGFSDGAGNLRNGLRDGGFYGLRPIGTVERVEVLKGPPSVLYGALEPGGVVNVITRQPLSDPYYDLTLDIGNNAFYQPEVDLSGPLTADDTLLYRLIAGYQTSDGVQEFVEQDLITVAPSITWNLSDRTRLNVYYEYADFTADASIPSEAPRFSDDDFLPRELYAGYPDFSSLDITTHRLGYTLNHEFSDTWQIRHSFAMSLNDFQDNRAFPLGILDDRVLAGFEAYDLDYTFNNYFAQIDVLGTFETGSISHQLLAGFDFNHYDQDYEGFFNVTDLPPLDIRNPNYDVPEPELLPFLRFDETIQSYGIYLQDQINLSDNLKVLVGGRYDWLSYENEFDDFGALGNTTDEPIQTDGAFSPRIGIVYQPIDAVSLYASYSRSLNQSRGFNTDGDAFDPTRGTQYEVGVRTDFLEGRLSANLALYHLTKTNITTSDSDNPIFTVQTGEARSRGVEFDINGEVLPGWNIIASYAYTNATVTEDNVIPIGNQLVGAPKHQASLWTTYEIQTGALEGLGMGLGLFYVGERQGDRENSFQLDSYLRTDAALYYRSDQFNAAVNIRNLFDIDYAAYSLSRFSVGRGEPFTIVGSIGWEF